MVKQIAAAAADSALGDTVLPRTLEAGSLGMDAEALHCVDHFFFELRATIGDQVARRQVVGKDLAQLLDDPGAAPMSVHFTVKDTPPIMRDDEEAAVENTKGQRRHGEEIHCRDGFTMVAQACPFTDRLDGYCPKSFSSSARAVACSMCALNNCALASANLASASESDDGFAVFAST